MEQSETRRNEQSIEKIGALHSAAKREEYTAAMKGKIAAQVASKEKETNMHKSETIMCVLIESA